MQIKYIFWDNDGVLVDTESYYLQASREALALLGIVLTPSQFADISLNQGRSIFDLATERGHAKGSISKLRTWRDKRYAELLEQRDMTLAGVREVLEKLHGKISMAIVTSSKREHFDIIHRQTSLLPFFDFYLTREDYNLSKPSAEPYLMALEKSGQQAQDVLVIEDSPRGLTAAKAAGLACWVIPTQLTSLRELIGADRILQQIDELPTLLL